MLFKKNRDLLSIYKSQPLLFRLYCAARLGILDIHKIMDFLPRTTTSVMELACGAGLMTFLLKRTYPDVPIRAYDLNPQRISILKAVNPYPDVSFMQKDVTAISIFDAELIVMSDLLHHLTYEQQRALLLKIKSTGPKQKTVIVKDMDRGRFSFRQLCNYLIDVVHTGEGQFYYHTKESFQDLFAACGYRIQSCRSVNTFPIPLNHICFVLEPVF